MLAVFHSSVATFPDELKNSSGSVSDSEYEVYSALKDDSLLHHFTSLMPEAFTVNLGSKGFLAFSSHPKDPTLPRLFASADEMFCMFQGQITNLDELKEVCQLKKISDESSTIVESCRTLRQRDRVPNPLNLVMRSIEGKFAFIVYDNTSKITYIGVDADGCVPLYWGTDDEDNVVVSTEIEIVKITCENSFGPFPKGCFFSSSDGLESFEDSPEDLRAMLWDIKLA